MREVNQGTIKATKSVQKHNKSGQNQKSIIEAFYYEQGSKAGWHSGSAAFHCAIADIINESSREMDKYRVEWFNMQ